MNFPSIASLLCHVSRKYFKSLSLCVKFSYYANNIKQEPFKQTNPKLTIVMCKKEDEEYYYNIDFNNIKK